MLGVWLEKMNQTEIAIFLCTDLSPAAAAANCLKWPDLAPTHEMTGRQSQWQLGKDNSSC